MSPMASQITSVSSVCSIVCSGADQGNTKAQVFRALVRLFRWASDAENVSIWWRHHVNVTITVTVPMNHQSIDRLRVHIEPGTKWPPFCRRHVQMNFVWLLLIPLWMNTAPLSELNHVYKRGPWSWMSPLPCVMLHADWKGHPEPPFSSIIIYEIAMSIITLNHFSTNLSFTFISS